MLTPNIFWSVFAGGEGCVNVLQQAIADRTSPLLIPMWFMRDLMVMVLLAPLFCWLLRKTRGWLLLVLGMAYVVNLQVPIPTLQGTIIQSMFFFGVGVWFALCRRGFAEVSARWVIWTLPLTIALFVVCAYLGGRKTDEGVIFFPLMSLLGSFAFIGCFARWGRVDRPLRSGLVSFAANGSFFIYAAHICFGRDLAEWVVNPLSLPSVLNYWVTPIVNIAVCLTVLWLMKRLVPRVTAVMLGERI